MSLTLGEKLRQAREERGFTLSEVAEQTRISSLYLESIENDDYKILPGGIFNKGFVKSFAKFVGINEQEALADYTKLISQTEGDSGDDLKVYRPEVLTDDRSGSLAPTIIVAVLILGLMTAGILIGLNYLRQPAEEVATNTQMSSNASESLPGSDTPPEMPMAAPEMGSIKVEFKATQEPVSLTATADGKSSTNIVTAGSAAMFEPKESLKLSYSRSLANMVHLSINGREIALPSQPSNPRRNVIDFEINKDNLPKIWESGSITGDSTPAANTAAALPPDSAAPVSTPARATPARPTTTPAARQAANGAAAANRATPPTDRVRRVPTPRPTVIVVPSANRP